MAGAVERLEWGRAARGGKASALNRGGSTSGDNGVKVSAVVWRTSEDHVWFEDRWMVTSLCDE
jgi:hypothetical protein